LETRSGEFSARGLFYLTYIIKHAMPRLNVETRTVHAICRHFAHKRDFALDSSSLAQAVRSKLPGAEVIHGTAADSEGPETCCWIRAGGRDYDVQRIAQRRRSSCAAVLSRYPTPLEKELESSQLGNRILCEGEAQEDEDASSYTEDLEGWSLPACSACCGKCRAHTLDSDCISPWKAQSLHIRAMQALARTGTWTAFKN
jgi:hypothetical protein